MNSSCPICEIRKWCPRGKEHSAFEVALISGFCCFKGFKCKNTVWGSLPATTEGCFVETLLFGHVAGAGFNVPQLQEFPAWYLGGHKSTNWCFFNDILWLYEIYNLLHSICHLILSPWLFCCQPYVDAEPAQSPSNRASQDGVGCICDCTEAAPCSPACFHTLSFESLLGCPM